MSLVLNVDAFASQARYNCIFYEITQAHAQAHITTSAKLELSQLLLFAVHEHTSIDLTAHIIVLSRQLKISIGV